MKHNLCPNCNKLGYYSERFDAFVCASCNTWLEPKCESCTCAYCIDRPEKPSDFYLGAPKTFATIAGDAIELEHFKSLVASGALMHDDGSVDSILVAGEDQVQLALYGWSFGGLSPISRALTKVVKLDDLDKMFPGKTIHIEWCNK